MRRTLLAAATAFVVGGIATGAVLSQAQPPAPADPSVWPTARHGHDGAASWDDGVAAWTGP